MDIRYCLAFKPQIAPALIDDYQVSVSCFHVLLQVFHMCEPDSGSISSFLCPNGTIFSQQYFVCDWWYNQDCAAQQSFAGLNQFLYQENENEIRCKTLFCIND